MHYDTGYFQLPAYYRPDDDFLRRALHNPRGTYRDGETAHSAHRGNGARRCGSGQIRSEHSGARQQLRTVREGGTLLYHVSRRTGDGHRGTEEQRQEGGTVRTAHLPVAFRTDLLGEQLAAQL